MEVVPGRFDIAEGWNLIPNGIYFLRAGGKQGRSSVVLFPPHGGRGALKGHEAVVEEAVVEEAVAEEAVAEEAVVEEAVVAVITTPPGGVFIPVATAASYTTASSATASSATASSTTASSTTASSTTA